MEIPALVQSLDLSREDDVPSLDWLAASCEAPDSFWSALFEFVREKGPPLRSRPGKSQDLYHDAVLRHVAANRPAFVWYERSTARSLSFSALDARASACAAAWAQRGAKAGAPIAIVLPLGPAFVVALAAALRLGLCVAILEPAGASALAARLEALGPAHVIFDPDDPPPLGDFAALALPLVENGPALRAPPYAYAPDEPCGRLFSPLRAPLLVPVDLPAARALEDALRDAVFAYRIGPGDALAAPDFPMQQHMPALLLSTLLAGATFVDVRKADLEEDPTLLEKSPITVLGAAPTVAAHLRRKPARLARLRHVFRSVDEPLDWIGHNEFIKKNDLARAPVSNVLVDAASGGCLLFSTRRPGSSNARALPAPGRPYLVLDSGGSGEPAVGATGVFVPLPGKEGFFILASLGAEFLYGSTLLPRRAARVYPASEVTARVSTLPGVVGAAVVPVPTGEPGARWAFLLLVFTGASDVPAKDVSALVSRTIRDDLGEDFLPQRVEIFPLFPRRVGKELDLDWCHRQYSSGILLRKAESPVFRDLTGLRAQMLGT
ncbi:AMP-binding protein [Polyangium sp. y55x31]|uniref:AMP-binding protein n=1 Tax=Polyangium sp. y55x31 TaxID=3042688 RepID=UPI002482DB37|nr:AMP-binding protein [Polyangium sp. y55x31]MDI1483058.1 AMP-binding protein [Polyangium sp. y55x31]